MPLLLERGKVPFWNPTTVMTRATSAWQCGKPDYTLEKSSIPRPSKIAAFTFLAAINLHAYTVHKNSAQMHPKITLL
jgi:hypothetical protein